MPSRVVCSPRERSDTRDQEEEVPDVASLIRGNGIDIYRLFRLLAILPPDLSPMTGRGEIDLRACYDARMTNALTKITLALIALALVQPARPRRYSARSTTRAAMSLSRSSTDSQGSTTTYDDSRGRVISRRSTSGNTTTIYDESRALKSGESERENGKRDWTKTTRRLVHHDRWTEVARRSQYEYRPEEQPIL